MAIENYVFLTIFDLRSWIVLAFSTAAYPVLYFYSLFSWYYALGQGYFVFGLFVKNKKVPMTQGVNSVTVRVDSL